MVDNEFKGAEQNHYIVGDKVLLVNNTFKGNLQLHEVAGYEVTAFHNVYDGICRIYQYAGTSILVFDYESRGNPFDVLLLKNPVKPMYELYPNDLSNYKSGAFNDLREFAEYSLGKIGDETPDITIAYKRRFLEDLKDGLKIKRPEGAAIVQRFEELKGNPIVNNRNSEAPEAPQRKIIQYLDCSELHKSSLGGDSIQLSDSIIMNVSNPCIMKAPVIILKNIEFPGLENAFNITGKKIVMVDNESIGPEQNHYIVGDNVLLVNNTYQGDLQVHEVAGYDVTVFQNVFDGDYRVHQYAATIILVFDN
ncbi:unnamed protein product, partial [Brenthis ino]